MQRIFLVFASVVCVISSGCEKPTAKFHPGDRVFVKDDPKIRGVISMRLSPLKEDLYYIEIPKGAPGSHPFVSEGDDFAIAPPTRQFDGAYRENELELDRQ